MEKNVILLSVIGFILMIIVSSCMRNETNQKNQENDLPRIIELVKDSNSVHVGNLTPCEVTVKDSIALITFFETPVAFTIHLTNKTSLLGVELIEDAISSRQALKIFIAKHSKEIVQINQWNDDSAIKNREKIVPISRNWKDPLPAEVYARQIQEMGYKVPTANDCWDCIMSCAVNWSYTAEGCDYVPHGCSPDFCSEDLVWWYV